MSMIITASSSGLNELAVGFIAPWTAIQVVLQDGTYRMDGQQAKLDSDVRECFLETLLNLPT